MTADQNTPGAKVARLGRPPRAVAIATTSQLKREANRRNAAKSTGPKTALGKSRARLNALKSGLYAAGRLLPEEDESAYTALSTKLFADFAPESAIEAQLVDQLVSDLWRLYRVERAEREYFVQIERGRAVRIQTACSPTCRRLLESRRRGGTSLADLAARPAEMSSQCQCGAHAGANLPVRLTDTSGLDRQQSAQVPEIESDRIGAILLDALVSPHEVHAADQIDARRRALRRDVMRAYAALEKIRERRSTIMANVLESEA